MITEQELKGRCTPEFIKWMCEIAEGFEFSNNMFFGFLQIKYHGINLQYQDVLIFPLLIHRAVEGWNKIRPQAEIIIGNCICYQYEDGRGCHSLGYYYPDYIVNGLTQAECACFHCLLDIYEGVNNVNA